MGPLDHAANFLDRILCALGQVAHLVRHHGKTAAGIACADLYLNLGVKKENIHFVDTVGVIYKGRTEKMNPYKERYAVIYRTDRVQLGLGGCAANAAVDLVKLPFGLDLPVGALARVVEW